MKKLLCTIVIASLLLTGCKNEEEDPVVTTETTTTTEATAVTASTASELGNLSLKDEISDEVTSSASSSNIVAPQSKIVRLQSKALNKAAGAMAKAGQPTLATTGTSYSTTIDSTHTCTGGGTVVITGTVSGTADTDWTSYTTDGSVDFTATDCVDSNDYTVTGTGTWTEVSSTSFVFASDYSSATIDLDFATAESATLDVTTPTSAYISVTMSTDISVVSALDYTVSTGGITGTMTFDMTSTYDTFTCTWASSYTYAELTATDFDPSGDITCN
ncbi:MAG: hypothetical protein QNL04_14915, partial [SAR324 cluster bacterium]|nr:hypothetical protein [SAR324 cluster bacterium]